MTKYFRGLMAWASVFWVAGVLAAAETKPALTPTEARKEASALRAEVERHDELYHRQGAPVITDHEYDQLKRRLDELERIAASSEKDDPRPAPRIGDDRTGRFPTVRHRERMLSLEKTYTEAELRAFHARVAKRLGRDDLEYVVEPKFDGFAISATYEKGKLIRVVTRGNGLEGDDITTNALAISGLPRNFAAENKSGGEKPPVPDLVELRGEVYMPLAEFDRINAEQDAAGDPRFASPRNFAAGTIRQTDPDEVTRRALKVVFYGIGACEPASTRPPSQRGLHAALAAWGLPGVERYWTARGANELWSAIQEVGRARAGFGFPTDGAVAKLDNAELQRELGATDAAPRWAIAFKFPPPRVETEVLAVTWQIGRTGVLTPVAELKPVELAGSKIARATLHNFEEIARRDVRIGDWVYVEKAGEVVPAIVGVDATRRPPGCEPIERPEVCPVCRTELAHDGGTLRCPNVACMAQVGRRLEFFASKECLDIKGLGPAMIGELMMHGWIHEVPDIYRLRRETLVTLGKDVGRTADQLLDAIERSKRTELWRVIHGLGIPRLGVTGAKNLARRFATLDALLAASSQDLPEDASGRGLALYFAEPHNREIVAGLVAAGVGRAMNRDLSGSGP